MKRIVAILIVLTMSMAGIGYAKVSLETKKPVTHKETQVERIVKSIFIVPDEERVVIRTRLIYYDAQEKEVRREDGRVIDLINREALEASPEGPQLELTEYTDFLKKAGIDFNKIIQAIPEGE